MHLIAGVLGQLTAAFLLKTRIAAPWPWLIVLSAALANEWFDLSVEAWPNRNTQRLEAVKDVLVTMLLPTLLLVISRWMPGLFVRCGSEDDEEAQP